MPFCTRCKRNNHFRSKCSAKTFKGGQKRIGSPGGGYRKSYKKSYNKY